MHRSHSLKIVLCERSETAGTVLKFLTACHMLRASVSYRALNECTVDISSVQKS